jgi:hypothetical protein
MTEGRLSRILRQLHLLARRDIELSQNGRILRGRIDPVIEDLREEVSKIHDRLLDGLALDALELDLLDYVNWIIGQQRDTVMQLERQYA